MLRPRARCSPRALVAFVLATSIATAACDIGDGTTLQDPVAPTTTTVDTTPLPSVAISSVPPSSVPLADSVLVGSTPGNGGAADPTLADGTDVAAFEVTTSWWDGDTIDPGFTCDGAGQTPIVSWSGVPEGTVELAVAFVDEARPTDAGPFVHWVVAGIDPAVGQLLPGELPPGAFEAINFFGDVGYGPPCPDPGTTGVYVLRLFAVGQQVESGFDPPAADLLGIIESVSFAVATSSGEYTR